MRSAVRTISAACAAALTAGAVVAVPAAATPVSAVQSSVRTTAWAGRNPAHNIGFRPNVTTAPTCYAHPRGHACSALVLRALNHARAVLHKRAYHVPSRFFSLPGSEQLLVLSNDDRRLYGLPQVRGLNAALDTSAHSGAVHDRDPYFVRVVHHHGFRAGTSNWAGGTGVFGNPLVAYYEWMYRDGPGGGNIDCPYAGAPGCWGHRHDTLHRFGGDQILMGASSGLDRSGFQCWTELYESFSSAASMTFVPTVTGLSRHSGGTAGGTTVVVYGFGFHNAKAVRVLGTSARVVKRSNTSLTIRTSRHASGSGYHVVYGNGGTSRKTYAAAFSYR